MSAYKDVAPDLSKAVTLTKFKEDHPKPVPPDPVSDEKPTKKKVVAVYNALLTMEQTGIGYAGVRRLTGVSLRWIKRVHKQMIAAKGVVWES